MEAILKPLHLLYREGLQTDGLLDRQGLGFADGTIYMLKPNLIDFRVNILRYPVFSISITNGRRYMIVLSLEIYRGNAKVQYYYHKIIKRNNFY